MADTRLILHVKGTDSETQELPKEEVKSAVAQGKLSQSQLIWNPDANAWKQVREWPDLLPGEESLILHVKGTASETREMPKTAVKEAISRGEITHSQLIWSATDSTWKQVREIPELLPGETMILHVKGTESETRELPKPAIRAAIQKGEISRSQLIWSPLDSAWKPVGDMPDLMPGESLILHVKGTTGETKEMPKKAIRTAIKEGKITHSQLIWNAADGEWKQVRDLPELLPSQKLAPAPARRAPVPMLENVVPESSHAPVAGVVATAAAAPPHARPSVVAPPRVTPQAKVVQPGVAQPAVAGVPVVRAASPLIAGTPAPAVRVAQAHVPSPETRAAVAAGPKVAQAARPAAVPATGGYSTSEPHYGHVVEEEEDHFHPMKWFSIVLGGLIGIVLLANYLMVDRNLQLYLGQTPYSEVFVYAHYGAFVQPNVVVIHIPRSDKLTPDNLTKFMVVLARSTPKNPLTGDYFEHVALTSGWTAQYSFPGSAWKSLGEMGGQSADDIRTQILSNGSNAAGQPLLRESTEEESLQEAKRAEAWKQFVSHFTNSGS